MNYISDSTITLIKEYREQIRRDAARLYEVMNEVTGTYNQLHQDSSLPTSDPRYLDDEAENFEGAADQLLSIIDDFMTEANSLDQEEYKLD